MVRARRSLQCQCGCRTEITVGSHYVRFGSAPWKSQHMIAYKKKRREGGQVK